MSLTSTFASALAARRYDGVSKRIKLRGVGRWALRPRGLLAEFVLVLMPAIEDGRPVHTASAPFLLNAEPGGGMGHQRSQPSDEWGRNPSNLLDDDVEESAYGKLDP